MSLRVCVREFVYETCFVCVQQQKYVACGDIQQIQKLTKNNNNKCNGNNNNNKIIVNAHNKTKNHSNYYYYREMLDVRRTRTTTTISPPSYHHHQPLNTPIRHCNSRLQCMCEVSEKRQKCNCDYFITKIYFLTIF